MTVPPRVADAGKRSFRVFGDGVAACSAQASAYGACMVAHLNDMHKDVCAKEFEQFKNCVQVSVKRRW